MTPESLDKILSQIPTDFPNESTDIDDNVSEIVNFLRSGSSSPTKENVSLLLEKDLQGLEKEKERLEEDNYKLTSFNNQLIDDINKLNSVVMKYGFDGNKDKEIVE
jgi:hypothetical protein